MKTWTEEQEKELVELLKTGLTYDEIGDKVGKSKGAVRVKLNKLGFSFTKIDGNAERNFEIKNCVTCEEKFSSLKSENRKFCCRSCSTTASNLGKKSKNFKHGFYSDSLNQRCLNCENNVKHVSRKFCSNSCQGEHTRKQIFQEIEKGNLELGPKRYRDYLIYKYDAKCMECGWNKINSVTGNVPIQMDHIDGNPDNNNLKNLRLLCPNCHSLTPTFGKLNAGRGKDKRNAYRKEWRDKQKEKTR